jgi:hypothetical protein
VKVLDRLGKAFPQYDAIVTLFDGQPPPRMRRHLESVYQDLFSFLQIAARIFTASNGSELPGSQLSFVTLIISQKSSVPWV